MGSDDWYRNKTWDAEIEAAFQQRLGRARDKAQYLRIQASYLADGHPHVALKLLDQFFELGENFDIASAHVARAKARLALGEVSAALASYRAALERERAYPHLKTNAYADFACLVAERRIVHAYAQALEALDSRAQDLIIFPLGKYRALGARALILHELGAVEDARVHARAAMAIAAADDSGLRYHGKVGIVADTDDAFGKRIAALAAAPTLPI